MLSEHFPAWWLYLFAGTASPIVTLVTGNLQKAWKPIALFSFALVSTVVTVYATPLEMEALIEQTMILFGIATGGYTMATLNPTNRIVKKSRVVGVSLVALGLGVMVAASVAQVPAGADSGVVYPLPPPPAPQAVQMVVLGFISLGAGYLARFVKKWLWF